MINETNEVNIRWVGTVIRKMKSVKNTVNLRIEVLFNPINKNNNSPHLKNPRAIKIRCMRGF